MRALQSGPISSADQAAEITEPWCEIEHKDPEVLVVLETSLFRVPRFQRSYVWTREQITDFDVDLWAGFEARKTWFIGTVIVARGDKIGRLGPALHLIDGQQRLTTIFIWLAALREECRTRGIDDWAKFIDTKYIRDVSQPHPLSIARAAW